MTKINDYDDDDKLKGLMDARLQENLSLHPTRHPRSTWRNGSFGFLVLLIPKPERVRVRDTQSTQST